ncbi:MAG: leucine-rich repeat protein [Prevotella sp.]|nr:leucine-rich repeat protein [Prevotella sp.]
MKKIYTRLFLLLMAVGMSTNALAGYFWINGTLYYDTQDYSDILDDGGSLSFDAATYTLTMNNCTGVKGIDFAKEAWPDWKIPTIRLIGENTMTVDEAGYSGAIYNQYGGIIIDGEYTGKLTMNGTGLSIAIQAGIPGEEFDGGLGYTGFTVTVKNCDLNITAQEFAFKIPEGTLNIIAANTYLQANGSVTNCSNVSHQDVKDIPSQYNTTNLLKTERWIKLSVDMGSDVVSERTYGSLERAVVSAGRELNHVNELHVEGAITGKDLTSMCIAAKEGELEHIDLLWAYIRTTGDAEMDKLIYSTVDKDNAVPNMVFSYAKKLKYLMLPVMTQEIGNFIVTGTQVERLLVPAYVRYIDSHAFDAENLKIVDLYDSLGRGMSEEDVFMNFFSHSPFMYSYLESIRVGEEVDWEYWKMSSLPGNYAYDVMRSVNGVLYTSDMKTLMHYPSRHKAVNQYGNYATVYDYDIPETVTKIEGYAFFGNENLSTIVIPESVTFIGYGAFEWQKGYKRIIVPASVSYGSDDVFGVMYSDANDDHGTMDIFLLNKKPASTEIVSAGFENASVDYITVRVPYQSLDAYKASDKFKHLNVLPMLVGTGETTPFYYDKPVYLSMSDWASNDSYDPVNAYVVVGLDETTGTAIMANLNPGNGSMIPASTAVVVKPTRLNGCYPFDILERPLNGPRRIVVNGVPVDNYLVGVASTTTVQPTQGNRYNYQLDGEKFVLMKQPVEMPAGSVYLQADFQKNQLSQTTVSADNVVDYSIPTSIDNAGTQLLNNEWRNLNGQRVNAPQRGVYINNGRKVVFK